MFCAARLLPPYCVSPFCTSALHPRILLLFNIRTIVKAQLLAEGTSAPHPWEVTEMSREYHNDRPCPAGNIHEAGPSTESVEQLPCLTTQSVLGWGCFCPCSCPRRKRPTTGGGQEHARYKYLSPCCAESPQGSLNGCSISIAAVPKGQSHPWFFEGPWIYSGSAAGGLVEPFSLPECPLLRTLERNTDKLSWSIIHCRV